MSEEVTPTQPNGDGLRWLSEPLPTPIVSTGVPLPVSYPRYGSIIVIVGFAVSVAGLTLSLASGKIWPTAILVVGVSILWVGTIIARGARKRTGRDQGANVWRDIRWTPTRSTGSPPPADHMSATA